MPQQKLNQAIKNITLKSLRKHLHECERDYIIAKALRQYYWNKADASKPVTTEIYFNTLNKNNKACKEMLVHLTKLRSAIKAVKGM
jgi:hypothetical protein